MWVAIPYLDEVVDLDEVVGLVRPPLSSIERNWLRPFPQRPFEIARLELHRFQMTGAVLQNNVYSTAETLDQARADFDVAWQRFSSRRTEADYQAWRDQRDWTARKYSLWESGQRLPEQCLLYRRNQKIRI